MKIKSIALLLVLSLPLVAHKCGKHKNAEQEASTVKNEEAMLQKQRSFREKANDKPDSYQDSLAFRFQRDACFGTCPVDIIEIFKSGYLVYTPMIHGVRDSISTAVVSKEDLEILYHTVKEVGFYDLPNAYENYIPDLPGYRIYVNNLEGNKKEIDVKAGAPAELRPLFNRFSFLLKNLDTWQDLK
ncbi:DUF6438 domain-containing protein [Luteibaculum oceani]|uniref:DUF6438 domain-containing protein n=1 Tax=Luteibaculum oceani TaxID=1294296 RepID=A0A5C6VAA5_9FLAO|nr:DUF6438 domain-containing protein [Luteibaculum oceani]TXC81724.1 hypothetical protein FRX97_04200 [Luteibaculum oceani]